MPELPSGIPNVAWLIIISGGLLTLIITGVYAACQAIGTIDDEDHHDQTARDQAAPAHDESPGSRSGTPHLPADLAAPEAAHRHRDADHPGRPVLPDPDRPAPRGTAPEEPGEESGRGVDAAGEPGKDGGDRAGLAGRDTYQVVPVAAPASLDEAADCCGTGPECRCPPGCTCMCPGCTCESWGDDEDGDATAVWAHSLRDQAATGRHGKPDGDPETDALDVLAAEWERRAARRALLDSATATDDLLARADAVLTADRHLRLAGV